MKTNIRVNVKTVELTPPTDKQVADFFKAEAVRLHGRLSLAQAIVDSGQTLIEAYRVDTKRNSQKIRDLQYAVIPAVAIAGIIIGACTMHILEAFVKLEAFIK